MFGKTVGNLETSSEKNLTSKIGTAAALSVAEVVAAMAAKTLIGWGAPKYKAYQEKKKAQKTTEE